MPNPTCFESCPVHALATHAVFFSNTSDKIFNSLSSVSGSSTINSLLKKIEETVYISNSEGIMNNCDLPNYKDSIYQNRTIYYSKGLTSHSIRSGANNQMNRCKDLVGSWVTMRCGRKAGSTKNVETAYLKSEWEVDAPCSRILSGWDRCEGGGKCPNIDCIPLTCRESFDTFTKLLFQGICPYLVSIKVCHYFSCILLNWFTALEESYPNHPLISRITAAAERSQILKWQEIIREYFVNSNVLFVPLTNLNNPSQLDLHNKQIESLNLVYTKINYLITETSYQKHFNSDLAFKMNALEEAGNQNMNLILNSLNQLNNNINNTIRNNSSFPLLQLQIVIIIIM